LLSLAALALASSVLVSRAAVDVPAGAETARRTTAAQLEETRRDTSFGLERLTYLSDGLKVTAFLYGPRTPSTPRPVVVYLRGGYLAATPISSLLPQFRTYAQAGYTVLAPQLRQSDGGEGKDEVGGADLADVMAVPALLAEIPGTDPARLYLLGESRGGMMAYQALRDAFPARAAAVYGGFTDLAALFEEHPEQYEGLAPRVWPDYPARKGEIFARRSALQWAERINAPVLILHGGADRSVDPSHALRLAARLQELEKTYELHVFEGDGHWLVNNQAERDRLVLAWFARYR
jgi:dipeptidyl aminopeptidase/acylaminoacyl peptidase